MADRTIRRGEVPQSEPMHIVGEEADQHPITQRLVEYEQYLGKRLERLDVGRGEWPWSWTVQQVCIFASEWDRPMFALNPLLLDMVHTTIPGGQRTVLETAVDPAVREKIERLVMNRGLVIGPAMKIPTGEASIDLRTFRGIGQRQQLVICINDRKFYGLVTGISEVMRDQLAEIASRSVEEWNRALQGFDHASEFAGEVRM